MPACCPYPSALPDAPRRGPRPDRPDRALPSFALHTPGAGADEYELLVDADHGLLLWSEARLDGEPFRVIEVTVLALDEEPWPEVFVLRPPDGTSFVEVEPPHVSR